jgi:hypothetical protein
VGEITGVITALFGLWMAFLGFRLGPSRAAGPLQRRSPWLPLGTHFLKLIGISFIAWGVLTVLHKT